MQPCFFIYECIWVKPSCQSLSMTKEALFRFTIFSFFRVKLIFNGTARGKYDSIKIAFVKTLTWLDTTWNFARSITRVSTHEHEHWEHCLCTEFEKKQKVFEQLTLAVPCSVHSCHCSWEVSISECNVTLKRVKVDHYCLPATTIHDISRYFSGFWFKHCFLYEAPFSTSRSILFFFC